MSENYNLDAYYKGMDRFIDEFAKKANLDPISARICAVQTLRAIGALKENTDMKNKQSAEICFSLGGKY